MIADNAIQTALPIDVPQTKRCTKCGEVKAVEEFSKNSRKSDHLHIHCKKCSREASKRYYALHKDEKKAFNKTYNLSHKDERKAYYDAHAGEYSEYGKAHRDARIFEYWAQYTIYSHKRRGHKIIINKSDLICMAINTITCPICGIEIKWGRKKNGHSIPESPSLDRKYNGNRISKDNSWIICHRCNAMKSSYPMPEFVAYCKMVADKFGGEYL